MSALLLANHNVELLLLAMHPATCIHPKAGGITLRI
ncbi:FAD-binding monooxygenase, partial [Bacillus cereus]|nr:FAD-binding monooxygenase [Bacillus cereus]